MLIKFQKEVEMLAKDIQTLMVQYEQKRRDANINLENRKEKIYKKNPRLKEIEDEINKISINKTKNILTNSLRRGFKAKTRKK